MTKKRRVGGLQVDPAVLEWQQQAASNPATLTRKQRADRQRIRVKYDMPIALKIALRQIGEREGTSASQAASALLCWAAEQYIAGHEQARACFAEKSPARTMQFDWNIEISERRVSVLESFRHDGDS